MLQTTRENSIGVALFRLNLRSGFPMILDPKFKKQRFLGRYLHLGSSQEAPILTQCDVSVQDAWMG